MKRRYLYSILFGIPGLIASAMLTILLFGAAFGFLWLFVFGDNPWPSWSEGLVTVALGLVFLVIWLAFISAGFIVGRRLEQKPGLNKAHILISAGHHGGAAACDLRFPGEQREYWAEVGGDRCSEFCSTKGYSREQRIAADLRQPHLQLPEHIGRGGHPGASGDPGIRKVSGSKRSWTCKSRLTKRTIRKRLQAGICGSMP